MADLSVPKVYVVNVEARYSGDFGSWIKVFSTKESAVEYALWLGKEKHLMSDVYEKDVLLSDVRPDSVNDHHTDVDVDGKSG
jgi:hypothetical protein